MLACPQVTGVATLQAPGVYPPFCILDTCWSEDHPERSSPSIKDCSHTLQPGSLQMQGAVQQQLNSISDKVLLQANRASTASYVNTALSTSSHSIVGIFLQVIHGLQGPGSGWTALSDMRCRCILALFDTCSTFHVPEALESALRVSSDTKSTGVDSATIASGAIKQGLAVGSLTTLFCN